MEMFTRCQVRVFQLPPRRVFDLLLFLLFLPLFIMFRFTLLFLSCPYSPVRLRILPLSHCFPPFSPVSYLSPSPSPPLSPRPPPFLFPALLPTSPSAFPPALEHGERPASWHCAVNLVLMGDIDLIEPACLLLTHYHTCLPRALSETAMTRQALRLALRGRGRGLEPRPMGWRHAGTWPRSESQGGAVLAPEVTLGVPPR